MIKISIRNPEKIPAILRGLSRDMQKVAMKAGGDQLEYYLRNNTEPPENPVTRFAAYGKTFFTLKQQRFFFAALKDGRITVPYVRTHSVQEGWERKNTPLGASFVNRSSAAKWTIAPATQTRHEKLVGWKTYPTLLKESMRSVVTAIRLAIRTYKLQRPWRK